MDRIKSISDRVAHTVLLALCNDPAILRRATEFADVLAQPVLLDDDEDDDEEENGGIIGDENVLEDEGLEITGSATRKRKASPAAQVVMVCERCERDFTEADNHAAACLFHEGELEPDYESGYWEEHDEAIHGLIDTEENRKVVPEGFFWDCCGQKGHERSGCASGWHVVPAGASKRVRLDEDEDEDLPRLPHNNNSNHQPPVWAADVDDDDDAEPIPEPYDSYGGAEEGDSDVEEVGPFLVADNKPLDEEEEEDDIPDDEDEVEEGDSFPIEDPDAGDVVAIDDDDDDDVEAEDDIDEIEITQVAEFYEEAEVIELDTQDVDVSAPLEILDDSDDEVRERYVIADDDDDDDEAEAEDGGLVANNIIEAEVVIGEEDDNNEDADGDVAADDDDAEGGGVGLGDPESETVGDEAEESDQAEDDEAQ